MKYWDDDAEVEFTLCGDVPCVSWTEDEYGYKSVYLDTELKETFISGKSVCRIDLDVKEK